VLIGHNGAGKSTLMSLLTGLLEPSSGSAHVGDVNLIDDISSVRKMIGYCPQYNFFWDELTARDHLVLFSLLRGIKYSEVNNSVDNILRLTQLSSYSHQSVKTFSGGMKRRLSVAMAGIGDPKILLFDEPTTGLDPISRRSVWKLINTLKQDRIVLLTTHYMDEAELLSNRIAIMDKGRLKAVGNALFLKCKFGVGFNMHIMTARPWDVISILFEKIPIGLISEHTVNSINIRLAPDSVSLIPSLLQ
jgi:ABC-type multidrug transport system ATPase subunit